MLDRHVYHLRQRREGCGAAGARRFLYAVLLLQGHPAQARSGPLRTPKPGLTPCAGAGFVCSDMVIHGETAGPVRFVPRAETVEYPRVENLKIWYSSGWLQSQTRFQTLAQGSVWSPGKMGASDRAPMWKHSSGARSLPVHHIASRTLLNPQKGPSRQLRELTFLDRGVEHPPRGGPQRDCRSDHGGPGHGDRGLHRMPKRLVVQAQAGLEHLHPDGTAGCNRAVALMPRHWVAGCSVGRSAH